MKKKKNRIRSLAKKNKKSFPKRKLLLFSFFLVLVSTLLYLLYLSPFFEIKKVEIKGNEKVSKEEISKIIKEKIENKILFLKTKNIFLFNIREAQNDILSGNILIDRVEIKKNLPEKIEVNVRERKPVAFLKENGDFYLIDKKGIVFERVERESDFRLIRNDNFNQEMALKKKFIEENVLSKIIEIKDMMNSLNLNPISSTIESERRVDFRLEEGWSVYFSLDKDLERQLIELKVFMEEGISSEEKKNLEYIDLRFERLFYK